MLVSLSWGEGLPGGRNPDLKVREGAPDGWLAVLSLRGHGRVGSGSAEKLNPGISPRYLE